MKNIIKITLTAIVTIGLSTSCNSWLNVTPASEIRENAQLGSAEGFQQVLSGIYINMSKQYGNTYTWGMLEQLAHQNNVLSDNGGIMQGFAAYAYKGVLTKPFIESIWANNYNLIANINNALTFIDENKENLNPIEYAILKGEFLALRAYLHFELLRCFGISDLANNPANGKVTIPYVTVLSKNMTPQKTYAETIKLTINDLKQAIELLGKEDPITGIHPPEYYKIINVDGFYNKRNLRMNYYAAQMTLARVYMWEGTAESMTLALPIVENVITEAQNSKLAKWITSGSEYEKDLLMASEAIFGLWTNFPATNFLQYFFSNPKNTDYNALFVKNTDLNNIFETALYPNDYRASTVYAWSANTGDFNNTVTTKKYLFQAAAVKDPYIIRTSPMIRLSEAALMAAETAVKQSTPDFVKATDYVNTLRKKRGITIDLPLFPDVTTAMAEIKKEYLKEFFYEGIVFYFYKRTGEKNIPQTTKPADDQIYMLPYPELEISMGRVQ